MEEAVALADPAPQTFAELAVNFRAIGDNGLARWGGFLAEEPIGSLTGKRWLDIVKQMTQTSPIIKGMLFAVEMIIRQAEFELQLSTHPDANPEESERAKQLVEECMDDMRNSWPDALSQILSFLPYGWSVFEIVYKRRLGPDKGQPSRYDDGQIGWDEWAPRPQDTIQRWHFDEWGHPTAFDQQSPSQLNMVTIPLSKCLHFRAGGYKGSPEGESCLRAAFNDWDAIAKLQIIEAIGVERDLAGLPVAWAPTEYLTADPSTPQYQFYQTLKRIVTGVRQNDQAGLVFPLEYDENGNKVYDFTLVSAAGQRQFDTGAVISRRSSQMAMSMLADFIMLGHQSTGTYSLSKDKTQMFTLAIGAWLGVICDEINERAIKPLLRLNNIDVINAPELVPGPLDETDKQGLSQILGAIQPFLQKLNDADKLALTKFIWNELDFPEVTTTEDELTEPPMMAFGPDGETVQEYPKGFTGPTPDPNKIAALKAGSTGPTGPKKV